MASIGRDENGRRRILFVAPDGKRRTLRLGEMNAKQADAIKVRVQQLLGAIASGAMDPDLVKWVQSRDDRMYSRLAGVGLVPPRERVNTSLSGMMRKFFDSLEVKPGTRATYEQTRDSLEAHFKPSQPIASITNLDAEQWRASLRERGLADATISKRVKTARQIFRQAVKWQMLPANPFAELRAGVQTNRERMHFVSRADAAKVLDACPDAEWRLLFALSRFGGLRVPSEALALKWADVDWARGRLRVPSIKTERYEGRAERIIPIFPELREHLQAAFDAAPEGTENVIGRYREGANLNPQLRRIVKRAGLTVWPRTWHNCRSSRQTELVEFYPVHVVCAWLGNTQAVALGHYLQVTDANFAVATGGNAEHKAAQNPAQLAAESGRNAPPTLTHKERKAPDIQALSAPCCSVSEPVMTPRGLEQTQKTSGKTAFPNQRGTESGTVGSGPSTTDPIAAWLSVCPVMLNPEQRAAVAALVQAAGAAAD